MNTAKKLELIKLASINNKIELKEKYDSSLIDKLWQKYHTTCDWDDDTDIVTSIRKHPLIDLNKEGYGE